MIHFKTMANSDKSCHETCCITPEDKEWFQNHLQLQEHYQEEIVRRCANSLNKCTKEIFSKQISGRKIPMYVI